MWKRTRNEPERRGKASHAEWQPGQSAYQAETLAAKGFGTAKRFRGCDAELVDERIARGVDKRRGGRLV